jgi:hypothetical protein
MSEAELRAMVRDLLRETLGKAAGKHSPATLTQATEAIRIANDADLMDFVQRLIQMLDDPRTGQAIRAGSLKFTLAGVSATAVTTSHGSTPITSTSSNAVLEGTVTEARVNKLAGSGTLVLAPGAVMTPLAKDRARALGLKIERKR